MNLFILRHGLAAELGAQGRRQDADRQLTPKGKQKIWRATEAMAALDLRFDVILSSPLVRALQTAEIVAEAFQARRKLACADCLSPDGSPKMLVDKLNSFGPKPQNVLLVGHEPYLSRLIAVLVAGNTFAKFELKKGGLAKLELSEPIRLGRCATLGWLLTPKQLGELA